MGSTVATAVTKAPRSMGMGQSRPIGDERAGARPGTSMRVLLVDHEPEARAQFAALCSRTENSAQIIGTVPLGAAAFQAADALRPDMVLLAARLPDMHGLHVLRSLRDQHRRRAVLITDNAAERTDALSAGALDYLMKPVTAEAFNTVLIRARGRSFVRKRVPARSQTLFSPAFLQADGPHIRPLLFFAERERRLYPLNPSDIDYVESDGNYVKYHAGKAEYVARESIKRLDAILCRGGFLRIEKSLLLNIKAIAFVESAARGCYAFTLKCGARLQSGAAYREVILQTLPLRRRAAAEEDQPEPESQVEREVGGAANEPLRGGYASG
jgi:two-component system LytT family response regulator